LFPADDKQTCLEVDLARDLDNATSEQSLRTTASDFDHDFEKATPYYYSADLQTWSAKADVALHPNPGKGQFA